MTQQMEQKNSENPALLAGALRHLRAIAEEMHSEPANVALVYLRKTIQQTADRVLSDAETAREQTAERKDVRAEVRDKLLVAHYLERGTGANGHRQIVLKQCEDYLVNLLQPSGEPRVAEVITKLEAALPHARAGYANAGKLVDQGRFAVLDEAVSEALALLRAKEGD